jgi:hypothetical protein
MKILLVGFSNIRVNIWKDLAVVKVYHLDNVKTIGRWG